MVEIRETEKQIVVPVYVQAELALPSKTASRCPFASTSYEDLLGYGVPAECLDDVRGVSPRKARSCWRTVSPGEAAEALLALSTGGQT